MMYTVRFNYKVPAQYSVVFVIRTPYTNSMEWLAVIRMVSEARPKQGTASLRKTLRYLSRIVNAVRERQKNYQNDGEPVYDVRSTTSWVDTPASEVLDSVVARRKDFHGIALFISALFPDEAPGVRIHMRRAMASWASTDPRVA